MFLLRKDNFIMILMNSDMVKPETFDDLHLVYHFTVPLRGSQNIKVTKLYLKQTVTLLSSSS